MARFPKPFYRESRQCWFVQLGKQQVKLHPDKEVAMTLYHQVMANHRKSQDQPRLPVSSSDQTATGHAITIVEIFDKYLDWCQKNRSPQTFTWYQGHSQSFVLFLKGIAQRAASHLKAFHVME